MPKLLKPSQALLLVKGMLPSTIWEDASPYICDNINSLWRKNKITDRTKDLLVNHINTILDSKFSLKNWLLDNKHITREQLEADSDGELLQYTRQNWLNDMHFHFKSKGM